MPVFFPDYGDRIFHRLKGYIADNLLFALFFFLKTRFFMKNLFSFQTNSLCVKVIIFFNRSSGWGSNRVFEPVWFCIFDNLKTIIYIHLFSFFLFLNMNTDKTKLQSNAAIISGLIKNVPVFHKKASKVVCLVLYPDMRLFFFGEVEHFMGQRHVFWDTR